MTRDRTKYDVGRKRSGATAASWQRSGVNVQIRCSVALRDRARAIRDALGCTLADVFTAGIVAMEERGEGGDQAGAEGEVGTLGAATGVPTSDV